MDNLHSNMLDCIKNCNEKGTSSQGDVNSNRFMIVWKVEIAAARVSM